MSSFMYMVQRVFKLDSAQYSLGGLLTMLMTGPHSQNSVELTRDPTI